MAKLRVVSMRYATFQGCYFLVIVEAPGCLDFGVRTFSECCALEKVGIIKGDNSLLAEGATLAPHVFESCIRLSHLGISHTQTGPAAPPMPPPESGIPQGCFHSSGIQRVTLMADASYVGHRAYENCKQLVRVDISLTTLQILNTHTFSHCVSLTDICLPATEIHAEAFKGCVALSSVALPRKLKYIAHRAFGNCNKLLHLCRKREDRGPWRRPYAERNAFELCFRLEMPWWLNYLPPNGDDWTVPPSIKKPDP